MGCEIKRDAEGRLEYIACSRGRTPSRCASGCAGAGRVVALCDYPLSGKRAGTTCSRPLCAACRRAVVDAGVHAKDGVDLCPAHHALVEAAGGWRRFVEAAPYDPHFPKLARTGTLCPDCGNPQAVCPSGVTCIEGHGYGDPSDIRPAPPRAGQDGPSAGGGGLVGPTLAGDAAPRRRRRTEAPRAGAGAAQALEAFLADPELDRRDRDLDMLGALVASPDLRSAELEAFADMREQLATRRRRELTPSQRSWVVRRFEELDLGLPGDTPRTVPRGREVKAAFARGPKRPPSRSRPVTMDELFGGDELPW